MDDNVLNASSKVEWTDEQATVEDIEEQYGFPLIVKTTAETSSAYDLPLNQAVLLVSKKNPIRLVAHTVEEGHYVMGKQLDIPSEYNGLFKLSNHFEREDIPMQTFRSIQEVFDVLPPKVYVQEQLTITLATDEASSKFNTVVLEKGDELTVINRMDSPSGQGNVYKPASRFISRVRRLQHNFLLVHCSRLEENLSLPTSIQGWFATRPPLFVHLLERKGIISLQQIMEQADFPLTVSVSTNSTRSVKDEFVLRSGMHFKLLGLEEHNVIFGVGTSHKIIEFSSTETTFKLPAVLVKNYDNEKEQTTAKNQYQTFVQSAFINSTLQNSPSNIEEHCMSVRFHIPRNRNPTNPRPLNNNAYLRNLILTPLQQRKVSSTNQELSAIHLLTTQSEPSLQRDKRTSMRHNNSVRRQLPVPDSSSSSMGNPPLPPRNSSQNPNAVPFTPDDSLPPVPPKYRAPLPPACDPPSISSVLNARSNLPADYPARQPPLPSFPTTSDQQLVSEAFDERDPNEENIFQEFVPRSKINHSPPIDEVTCCEEDDFTLQTNHRSSSSELLSDNNSSNPISASSGIQHSLKRSDSPCFALNLDPEPQPGFEVYENMESMINDRRSSLPPPRTCRDSPSRSSLNQKYQADHLSLHSGEETGSEKSSASGRSNPVHYNGLDVDDVPVSIASNSSSVADSAPVADRTRDGQPLYRCVTAPAGWVPPTDIKSMGVNEVSRSLRYIGISETCVESFRAEMIDGYLLTELTDEILEEDFLLSKLHRFKIKRFIQGWRPRLSSTQ